MTPYAAPVARSKSWFSALSVLTLVGLLASCGDSASSTTDTVSPATASPPADSTTTAAETTTAVTESGDLDPGANFFAVGYGEKLVYSASAATDTTRERLGSTATVIDGGEAIDMCWVSEDLHRRGVRRLMVEGGGKVHTQFLTADLADELHLAMAPFFVGDSRARRFVGDGRYPWGPDRRATLADTQRFDDVVLLRYSLSPRFRLD